MLLPVLVVFPVSPRPLGAYTGPASWPRRRWSPSRPNSFPCRPVTRSLYRSPTVSPAPSA